MTEQIVRKLFTVEEANQRLPLVRAIVTDIVELHRDTHERRQRLKAVRQRRGDSTPGRLYDEEVEQIEEGIQHDEAKLNACVHELQELGVEFKDPVKGLVDFPALMENRVVYLCWKLGEPEVQFWHELNEGFAERCSLLESTRCTSENGESSLG